MGQAFPGEDVHQLPCLDGSLPPEFDAFDPDVLTNHRKTRNDKKTRNEYKCNEDDVLEYECQGLDCIDAVGVQVVLSACSMVSVTGGNYFTTQDELQRASNQLKCAQDIWRCWPKLALLQTKGVMLILRYPQCIMITSTEEMSSRNTIVTIPTAST